MEQRPGYFDEELIVPIVENAREDYLLCDTVAEAIRQYPQTNAVILRQEPLNQRTISGCTCGPFRPNFGLNWEARQV